MKIISTKFILRLNSKSCNKTVQLKKLQRNQQFQKYQRLLELTKFTTYFDFPSGSKRYESGFSQQLIDDQDDQLFLELWKTDFHLNIFEKEKTNRFIKGIQKVRKGEREGRNQHGQYWNEQWHSSSDGSVQGWSKYTQEENDSIRLQWGESQEQETGKRITKSRWQEKYEKENDYWENHYEQETQHINYSQGNLVREGQKLFKNNRNYIYNEEWKELNHGEINVKKFIDDGYGSKKTEYFTMVKKEEHIQYEYSQSVIEDVAQNKKIEIEKGKNYFGLNDEWEKQKIIDFSNNFERVCSTGKNQLSQWKEEWLEKYNEKWAYKEGANFFTNDQWKEEWYERKRDGDMMEECKAEKWGKNNFEEWNEKWGEVLVGEKKEKWTDKWTTDLQTGFRKGQNWGHELDNNLQPRRHWVENWDNEGKIIKREEHY